MDAFLLKKLVSNVVHLIPGALFLLLLGVLMMRGWPRLARALLLLTSSALLALSSPPVSNAVVGSLEQRFAVLPTLPPDTGLVLVLGLGHHWQEDRPPNSVLMAGALSRLSEAVRLWKTLPDARLMVSGARFRSEISHAEAMGNMARVLGVDERSLVYSGNARDTRDEIEAALAWLQQHGRPDARLVVVSSAMHLPRAQTLLQDSGRPHDMAPTDFKALDAPWYRFAARHLADVDAAVHEYVGMLWYRLAP